MLVLASASPARRRLLEQAGLPHRVRVSGVDEEAVTEADPLRLVQRLAAAKAWAVAGALASDEAWPSWGVLGCDSLLVVQGEVWGKPRDAAEAVARWRRMAGGWGELHTGHCLLSVPDPGSAPAPQLAVVTTRVLFAALTTAGDRGLRGHRGAPGLCRRFRPRGPRWPDGGAPRRLLEQRHRPEPAPAAALARLRRRREDRWRMRSRCDLALAAALASGQPG